MIDSPSKFGYDYHGYVNMNNNKISPGAATNSKII